MIIDPPEATQAPASNNPVERCIDVDEEQMSFGFEQMNIIDHLSPPPIHIEDGTPHEMLVDKDPAGLIDEWRIRGAGLRRFHKDRILLNLDNPLSHGMNCVGLPQPNSIKIPTASG